MILALAQINSDIGRFEQNRQKIITVVRRAAEQHADLVLFPRWTVCGEPPMMELNRQCFIEQSIQTVQRLQKYLQEFPKEIAVGLGFLDYSCNNSPVDKYGVFLNGKLVFEQSKILPLECDVFDNAPKDEPEPYQKTFEFKGQRIGFVLGNDMDLNFPEILESETTFLVVPSASPFVVGKHQNRRKCAQRTVQRCNIPLAYINAVGANDQIVFDGCSFFCNSNSVIQSAKPFEEDLFIVDTSRSKEPSFVSSEPLTSFDEMEQALILGIRDYVTKNGFQRCHLGLSGGIDSVLVAYLAVQAMGKDNVACFNMPSQFSSQGSKDDSAALAAELGCRYAVLSIEPCFDRFLSTLKDVFEERPFDVTEENLQARIRGTLMMAYSNKFHSMLLTTGNKSELAMGYCTLYGDMNGSLAPIGDLYKTEIFALCRNINARHRRNIISESVLTKPPSAELRLNQTDQDTLPPYEVLDEILKLYLGKHLSAKEINARTGFDLTLITKIIRSVALSEFKRYQAPPVLSVSLYPFGRNKRMPLTGFVDETE